MNYVWEKLCCLYGTVVSVKHTANLQCYALCIDIIATFMPFIGWLP